MAVDKSLLKENWELKEKVKNLSSKNIKLNKEILELKEEILELKEKNDRIN